MPRTRTATGLDSLEMVTRLLQRARLAHPTAGLFEAADLQWWWRVERSTDSIGEQFWVDDAGEPVGAVVFTDWGRALGCDLIVVPGGADDLIPTMWSHTLDQIRLRSLDGVEVTVRDDDPEMVALLTRAGFTATDRRGATTWMDAVDRPEAAPLPDGYRLADRAGADHRPHHMIRRSGAEVARRLAQTSLYRPDLDLSIETDTGDVVAYGLFWSDPVTEVGLVEPMRTEEGHEGKGLARHVLLSGLERLTALGATRLKVSHEIGNLRAERLYLGAGFVRESTDTVYALRGVGPPLES
jgi:RimJ/RimL family protein N-acetyltransferase